MKKIWFYLLFLIFILFPFSVFAEHACDERCRWPDDIRCDETTGTLRYRQGSCNSGLACYSGAGNVCRNPYCPDINIRNNCICPSFTIQGSKQPNQSPFSNQTISLDGRSSTTAQPYFFTNVVANTIHQISASSPPGSSVGYTLCYNNTTCHSLTPTPVAGNSVYICSNKVINNSTNYVDIRWHYTPLIPNCKNIRVNPVSPLVGDTVTITADYDGPVTSVGMVVNPQGSCSFSPLNVTQSAGAGTYSFNWTPTNAGNYDIFCRAWNDGVAECRGMCVDGPPRYQCRGSDGNGATSYRTITVQNPGPWYKLKDASLNKIGNHDIVVVQNIKKFTDSDPDDDNNPGTGRYVIINSSSPSTSDPGILLATNSYNPGPSYNPIPDSTKGWRIGSYGNISQPMFASFYQYLKSRKQIEEITGISQINKDGIYFIKTDNLTISNQPPNYNFVLIVRNSTDTDLGNITININNNNFNTNNQSIMILAKKITFSSSVTTAAGIFIAQTIEYQSTNGLKVLGNLISKTAVTLQSRSDNTRPSLFIVFKPKMYLDLLPYLSISKYDWRRLQ